VQARADADLVISCKIAAPLAGGRFCAIAVPRASKKPEPPVGIVAFVWVVMIFLLRGGM
jgi:hypothetical protein